jgi:hypothetical protein
MSNDASELQRVEAFLKDPDFKKLNSQLLKRNIFGVIGASWNELSHSRAVAAFLNPSELHGFSASFLRRFLSAAAEKVRANEISFEPGGGQPLFPLQAEGFSFSDVRVDTEYGLSSGRRLDIVIRSEVEEWLCVIENKVEAGESPQQTTDYYEQSIKEFPPSQYKSRLFVYLTPKGYRPSSSHFVSMSYGDIKPMLLEVKNEANEFGKSLLEQYVHCLEDDVMGSDTLRTLCWKLYQRHRLAIQTLNRYSWSLVLYRIMEEGSSRLQAGLKDPEIPREWSWTNGSNWVAFWPKSWPTRRGSYPVYYGVSSNPFVGGGKVSVYLKFEGETGNRIGKSYEENAKATGHDTGKDRIDLTVTEENIDEKIREGVETLIDLISNTLTLVNKSLPSAPPDA